MLDGNEYTDSEPESDEFEEEGDLGSPGHWAMKWVWNVLIPWVIKGLKCPWTL